MNLCQPSPLLRPPRPHALLTTCLLSSWTYLHHIQELQQQQLQPRKAILQTQMYLFSKKKTRIISFIPTKNKFP